MHSINPQLTGNSKETENGQQQWKNNNTHQSSNSVSKLWKICTRI